MMADEPIIEPTPAPKPTKAAPTPSFIGVAVDQAPADAYALTGGASCPPIVPDATTRIAQSGG
jgi:hypothetical protein